MIVEMTFKVGGAVERLADMHKRIVEIKHELPDTLAAWQEEELHRKPFVKKLGRRPFRVGTIIRPHSRHQMLRALAFRDRGFMRVMRKSRKLVPGPAPWSTRPALRPEALEDLTTRLAALVSERLRW